MPDYSSMSVEELRGEVAGKAKGLASKIAGGVDNNSKSKSDKRGKSMDAKKVIEDALGGDAAKAGAVYDALKSGGLLKEEKSGEDPSEKPGDEKGEPKPPFGKDAGAKPGEAKTDKKEKSYDDMLGELSMGSSNMGGM